MKNCETEIPTSTQTPISPLGHCPAWQALDLVQKLVSQSTPTIRVLKVSVLWCWLFSCVWSVRTYGISSSTLLSMGFLRKVTSSRDLPYPEMNLYLACPCNYMGSFNSASGKPLYKHLTQRKNWKKWDLSFLCLDLNLSMRRTFGQTFDLWASISSSLKCL